MTLLFSNSVWVLSRPTDYISLYCPVRQIIKKRKSLSEGVVLHLKWKEFLNSSSQGFVENVFFFCLWFSRLKTPFQFLLVINKLIFL